MRKHTPIHLGSDALTLFADWAKTIEGQAYILVDTNTRKYCLPKLIEAFPDFSMDQLLLAFLR